MPMALALPRIGGPRDVAAFPGEEVLPVDLRAAAQDLSGGVTDLCGLVVAAACGEQHTALAVGARQCVSDVRTQYRVRADLHVDVLAAVHQGVDRLLELHGLAHIAPP